MKRIKSIDTFRGLSMLWMFMGHLQLWWIVERDRWIYYLTLSIFDVIGASAFLFISGLSLMISYKKKTEYNEHSKSVRNEYLFRTALIFTLAILYNLFIVIATNNPLQLWTWFVLLTIAVSMLLAYPILKYSKILRIFIGVTVWVVNYFLYAYLSTHKEVSASCGLFYYILYNTPDLDPILSFFPFFLFGTVVGDIIYDIYKHENHVIKRIALRKKLLVPSLIIGPALVAFGVWFGFPLFFTARSFSWLPYTLGIILCLLSLFLFFEEFVFYNVRKSYKFLYYFSYYSLTIFLTHNILYFLFYQQLTLIQAWVYIFITTLMVGLLFRFVYMKWGNTLSLKYQIGRLSYNLALLVENVEFRIWFEKFKLKLISK
ncbi:MAG: DUF1624 domain-containing protein [Candidatus Lokiarchaeota archaeon]|nr:DUF1624 domain-containing protein [Candidatus Lokiarchaeota archaeon]MBD3338460.1 DUF1624 domain-containing protein [Candidatus Lokiarchaeota archaeon]